MTGGGGQQHRKPQPEGIPMLGEGGTLVSPQPLPSPWPGAGWGGAVPLSFPSTEEAPAPKGLRSWSIGEGGEAEPDSRKTPSTPHPTLRKHEQERLQEVRGPSRRPGAERSKALGLLLCGKAGRH